MPTILTKKSDTPGAVPATANLTNAAGGAELAVNTADKRLFTINSSSGIIEVGTNPSSLTCADASFTVARVGSLTITSLTLTNATVTSATVTTLTGTSANITTLSGTNLSYGSATITTGNLAFTGTAQRITGDMSNATVANRLAFQTSTTNGNTVLGVLPNGTATTTAFQLNNNSDTTAALAFGNLQVSTSEFQIGSAIRNAGTYVPMTFYTGGSERVRIDTSGNVGIGTSSPGTKLDAYSSSTTSTILRARNDTTTVYLDANNAYSYLNTFTNHPMLFGTNNTERMRIDSSGNVGIGGTAAAYEKLRVSGFTSNSGFTYGITSAGTIPSATTSAAINISSVVATQAASFTLSSLQHFQAYQSTFGAGSSVTTQVGFFADSSLTGATNNYGFYSNIASGSNRWNFYAAGTANNYFAGSLGVGSNPANWPTYRLVAEITGSGNNAALLTNDQSATTTVFVWNKATSGDNLFIQFATDGGATVRGSIDYNRAGGAVRYNTTSDYRAKDVFGAWDDAGATIDALKVYRGKMHGATLERPMMIAHEAQAVVPYAVSGEKDAVDKDGKPVYQQMDHQVLVPLLIAELQAVRARLAALEAK